MDTDDADRRKVTMEVGMWDNPGTYGGMGLQLQVSARSKAAAVPPGGPHRLRELHLFIIAIYIVPGICRRLQRPHALIRPRHALGAGACLEEGEMEPVLESPSALTWLLGQGPLSLPPGTSPNQAVTHYSSSCWTQQPKLTSVSQENFLAIAVTGRVGSICQW